jgi:hypothetical protein
LQQIENKKYGNIVSSWPRKRPGPGTPAQQTARQNFAKVCKQIKYAIPEDMIAAIEFTQGTGLLPRDVLMAAAFGTLITGYLKDGRVLYGARVMADEIQPLLDGITSIPGSMLFRGPTGWIGVPPGNPGDVLTYQGSAQPPAWTDPTFGTFTGAATSSAIASATDTSGYACKGNFFLPIFDISLVGFTWAGDADATADYWLTVYAMSGNTIAGIASDQGPFSLPTTTQAWFAFGGLIPTPLVAGTEYVIAVRVSNKGDSYGLTMDYHLDAMYGEPNGDTGKLATLAKATPAPGDTFNVHSPQHWAQQHIWRW